MAKGQHPGSGGFLKRNFFSLLLFVVIHSLVISQMIKKQITLMIILQYLNIINMFLESRKELIET